MKQNICNLKLSPFLKWTVFLFCIFGIQISASSAEELSFKHLTVNQGLGSNQIHSMPYAGISGVKLAVSIDRSLDKGETWSRVHETLKYMKQ